VSGVNAALAAIDESLTARFATFDTVVSDSVRQESIPAMLTGSVATLALLLAGLGLYGSTAYSVARRPTEMGIRMALGAVQT
jgi:ABC-type antimicrobial peptide transport system permease subunit